MQNRFMSISHSVNCYYPVPITIAAEYIHSILYQEYKLSQVPARPLQEPPPPLRCLRDKGSCPQFCNRGGREGS